MKNILILAFSAMSICPINASNVDDDLSRFGGTTISHPNRDTEGGFEIFIKTLTGETFLPSIHPNQTVLDLKKELLEQAPDFGSTQNMRLIIAAEPLKDDKLLSFYNIQRIGTIHLVRRPTKI